MKKSIVFLVCLFLTVEGSKKTLSLGQHFYRFRPKATNKLPIPPLEEDPDEKYNPTPNDIDPVLLNKTLGDNYLFGFMSHTYPRDFDNMEMTKKLPDRIPGEIRKLFKRKNLPNISRRQLKKLLKNKRLIQSWLYQETACPVHYHWTDLGIRFWPRYIKEGYCNSTNSCSIPAGMKCKASDQTRIVLLRWICQGILKQKHCSWRYVYYPVISECSCQC